MLRLSGGGAGGGEEEGGREDVEDGGKACVDYRQRVRKLQGLVGVDGGTTKRAGGRKGRAKTEEGRKERKVHMWETCMCMRGWGDVRN